MKISTKGRYGIKAMVDLAFHNSDGPVSLKTIAERQNLSENYLEQLFAPLRKAGIVKSVRGAQGGYQLAKSADLITVGAMLRVLEGSLAPVECVDEGEETSCQRSDECITRFVWERVRDSINNVVDSISLEHLVKEYKKSLMKDNYIYYI